MTLSIRSSAALPRIMRINLPLHPHHFAKQPAAGPSTGPLAQLGGDLVLIELQGELSWEGDKTNGVVGVIGLDRPVRCPSRSKTCTDSQDKPTLHLGPHHLLHGKFVNLQKPYAVIRKAIAQSTIAGGITLEGDASDEELDVEGMTDQDDGPSSAKKRRIGGSSVKNCAAKRRNAPTAPAQAGNDEEEEEEDDPPLFPADPDMFPSTPMTENPPASSSPFYPASAPRDYSSELDPGSSPARWDAEDDEEDDEERQAAVRRAILETEKGRRIKAREKRKKDEKERTRSYEVVGIVRKKVVFHLR